MKHIILLLIFAVLFLPVFLAADTYDTATLAAITVSKPEDVRLLHEIHADITSRRGDIYKVLLKPDQLRALQGKGLNIQILYDEMAEDRRLWKEADDASKALLATAYYTASKFNTTNPAAGTLMEHLNTLHTTYPSITRLYNLGATQDGNYDIIAMKVTRNPDTAEAEPKIRIYGNIHGDEKSGLMVACDVLDWILANYASDPSAQKLVNESEMWFIPMGNPWGNANNNRANSRAVDLNRNFWGPAGSDDGYPSVAAWTEKETQAIRDLTETATADHSKKRFTTSISFHAGDTCFNSVWNYVPDAPTDEPIFWSSRTGGPSGGATPSANGLAKAYQDGCTTSGFWFTEGYDWYQTLGDTNDWAYGQWTDLDTTVELTTTKTPTPSPIPTFCAEHRQAVINYMLKTFQGIHGVMTDQSSGNPLDGTVAVTATASSSIPVPHDYQAIYSDPVTGDFHRVLQPGTYTMTCSATGYQDTVVSGLVVTADTKTAANCPMTALGAIMSFQGQAMTDACSGTGTGVGNGYVDAGEDITVHPTLKNAGFQPAAGISATLSTGTPGITVVNATAAYPDLAVGASGVCASPHFTFRVGTGVACGTVINFTLTITAASGGGPWMQNFSMTVGHETLPGGTLFSETFDTGVTPPALPSGWATVQVSGTRGAWATNAGTNNPSGGGTNTPPNLVYFNSYFANIGDSTRFYRTSGFAIPAGATSATWTFYMFHDNTYSGYNDRIQPQVSTNGTTWVNAGSAILRYSAANAWSKHTLSLNTYIGQTVQIALLGISEYGTDCHIDTVLVTYAATGGCTMSACTPSAGGPKPVPDGRGGKTPMTAVKISGGTTINVSYDASCAATDTNLLYGALPVTSAYTLAGAQCHLTTNVNYAWAVGASTNLWFLLATDNGAGKESSWGKDSAGLERHAGAASGYCSTSSKDASGTCP